MTTVSQIISDAFREANIIAIGTDPTTAEQTEALRLLNRFVMSLFGTNMGEALETISTGRANIETPENIFLYLEDFVDYYIPENTRVQANLTAPATFNLCPLPKDGARIAVVDNSNNFATYNLELNGNGRTIEGNVSIVLNTNSLVREWFYREDLGSWARLTELELTSDSPFPIEFDDMLILGLAQRLNPRMGVTMDPQSQAYMVDIRKKFKSRYRQTKEVPVEQGIIRLPSNKFSYASPSDTLGFTRGLPRW